MKWPLVVLQEDETTNPWVKFCRQRVRANDSLNIVCTGQTGTGKSWAMIGFAKQYNPNWSLDYCYFKASDFVKALEGGTFKPGDCIIYDEAGIDLNSAAWQNELNQAINLIFQTMRHRRLILIMTMPFMSFLQAKVRKLVTAHFKAQGYDKETNSFVRPLLNEYNGDVDKFYRKRLMVRKGKRVSYCDVIKIPKADQELLEKYEAMKKQFTTDLYKQQRERLEVFEEKKKDTTLGSSKLTPKQVEVYSLLRMGKTLKEASEVIGCSPNNIQQTKSALLRKGYQV